MRLKEQVRKVMMEHLQSKGFPNLSTDEILQELKPMWIKIEEAGLKQSRWTFQQFSRIAQDSALFSRMRNGNWFS